MLKNLVITNIFIIFVQNNTMKFIDLIKSTEDNTLKYIFKLNDDLIVEFSYINKNDGKDIICVPTQTMCNQGCKFCHTSDYIGKIKARNLEFDEINYGVVYILNDLKIEEFKRTLLISYMGCGEPILNYENVINSMTQLKRLEDKKIPYVRFAIATSIPKNKWINFYHLTDRIKEYNLPVKIHLSLHYTIDKDRNEWMPASLDIKQSIACMDFYKIHTGNPVEIHYALIDGVNDLEVDAIYLVRLLKDKGFIVKFLFYNEKESIDYHASKKEVLDLFKYRLDYNHIDFEYYVPPGLSIGASCGSFLMDYDQKYKNS